MAIGVRGCGLVDQRAPYLCAHPLCNSSKVSCLCGPCAYVPRVPAYFCRCKYGLLGSCRNCAWRHGWACARDVLGGLGDRGGTC